MIFLSHIEERQDHLVEGLTGLEIYNRHWDAKRDPASLLASDDLQAVGGRNSLFSAILWVSPGLAGTPCGALCAVEKPLWSWN